MLDFKSYFRRLPRRKTIFCVLTPAGNKLFRLMTSSPLARSDLDFGSVVVDFLFIVTPIVGVCNCSMFCCTLLYVHSSIAIILMGKRELIALLNLSSWCLVMVERLFLAVPRGCLQFVIVVFLNHTHLLFLTLWGHLFWRGVKGAA